MVLKVMPQAAEQNRLIALRLGCLVEHPERRPHMPHFVADDVADDRGHFDNGKEFRPSRPVALARVARWIEERGDRNAGRLCKMTIDPLEMGSVAFSRSNDRLEWVVLVGS